MVKTVNRSKFVRRAVTAGVAAAGIAVGQWLHAVPAGEGDVGAVSAAPMAATAEAQTPPVAAWADVMAGVSLAPTRWRSGDYRRAAFGEAWTDDNTAPGGHNRCDTRNDILNRDLIDKTFVSISRCPRAVATGVLLDPYTSKTINFVRGNNTGAAVQIDHIVPLAYAWDQGARSWPQSLRIRFANDPANLLAVDGKSNQDKRDKEPAAWMPPNAAFHCQYALKFVAVMRDYRLAIDEPSVPVLRQAAATCPVSP
ncbi:HNH endonuclease family protein [Mycolicibacterium conceptionense]|uniref:HNH endonuclease family protein n=1 Tax=Mycolicibacterium conceptionense TaxID=451644 RepID=UPI003204A025